MYGKISGIEKMGNWCKTLNPLAPVFAFLWHRHEWSIPLVKQDSRREALDSCSDPYLLKQPVNRCFACVRFSELRVLDYYIFRYQPSDFWKTQLFLMRDIDFMLWCVRTYHRVRISEYVIEEKRRPLWESHLDTSWAGYSQFYQTAEIIHKDKVK